jgi:hypothetical protein
MYAFAIFEKRAASHDVIGWGAVAFALLYDFFVTHAGVFPWREGGVW